MTPSTISDMSYRALGSEHYIFITSIHVFYFYSVSAFMVLSIISSVYSVPWFVYSCITTNTYSYSYRYSSNVVIYGIQILISLIESVIAITASGYSCRVFCCGKVQNPGAIQYQNPGTMQYQNPGPQNPGTVLYSPGQGAVAIQNPQTLMVSPGAIGYQNPVTYSQQMTAPQMAAPQMAAPQMAACQIAPPLMAAPQMAAPQMTAPQMAMPQMAAPQMTATQMAAPKTLSNQNVRSASPSTSDEEIIGM